MGCARLRRGARSHRRHHDDRRSRSHSWRLRTDLRVPAIARAVADRTDRKLGSRDCCTLLPDRAVARRTRRVDGASRASYWRSARLAPPHRTLLAQATTALAELDHAEKDARRAVANRTLERADWSGCAELSATSERPLASRAHRTGGRAMSAFLILPLFGSRRPASAFAIHLSSSDAQRGGRQHDRPGSASPRIAHVRSRCAAGCCAAGGRRSGSLSVPCLCGVGDTLALLMADRAFGPTSPPSRSCVLVGSMVAAGSGWSSSRVRRARRAKAEARRSASSPQPDTRRRRRSGSWIGDSGYW